MHRLPSNVAFLMPLVLTLAVVALVGCPGAAAAEEDSPLRAGAWAAEFELDPRLFGYTGSATLAVKRHGSSTQALRFGLNVGFSEEEDDGMAEQYLYEPPYYPIPQGSEGSVVRHRESHLYAPFIHFVREWPVRDRVAIFGEFGPSFRYLESKYHSESIYGFTTQSRSTLDEVRVERLAALDFALGFEWFFSKRISLGARYGAYFAYRWGSDAVERLSVQVGGPSYLRESDQSDLKGSTSARVAPRSSWPPTSEEAS